MSDPADFRRAIPDGAAFSDWVAADGWRHRRFDWPHDAPRGRILVQGGRADIIEKYLETIAHLHEHRWSVTAFDWRGQGGSGRLSDDPRVGHADDFGVFTRDLAEFWRAWRGEKATPAMLLGHSMGAHISLRALLEGAIDPAAVVLVAPMVAIRAPVGAYLGQRLASYLTRRGDPARAAWRVRRDQRSAGHRQRLLTHDIARFEDEAWWYERKPELLLGPPSWAWVLEAFRSGTALQTDSRLADIATPVLMLVPEHDGLVDARASLRLASKLPDVTLVRFGKDAAHEVLRETDSVRRRTWAAIDAFLDNHAT